MYHECMINVHYYYCSCPVCAGRSHQDLMKCIAAVCLCRAVPSRPDEVIAAVLFVQGGPIKT